MNLCCPMMGGNPSPKISRLGLWGCPFSSWGVVCLTRQLTPTPQAAQKFCMHYLVMVAVHHDQIRTCMDGTSVQLHQNPPHQRRPTMESRDTAIASSRKNDNSRQ